MGTFRIIPLAPVGAITDVIMEILLSAASKISVRLTKAVVGNHRAAARCRFVRLLPVRMRFQNKCFEFKTFL